MFGGPISGDALWLYLVGPVVGTSLGGLGYQFVRGEAP
jgi:glycerol uptake facilitator-like aquaporin